MLRRQSPSKPYSHTPKPHHIRIPIDGRIEFHFHSKSKATSFYRQYADQIENRDDLVISKISGPYTLVSFDPNYFVKRILHNSNAKQVMRYFLLHMSNNQAESLLLDANKYNIINSLVNYHSPHFFKHFLNKLNFTKIDIEKRVINSIINIPYQKLNSQKYLPILLEHLSKNSVLLLLKNQTIIESLYGSTKTFNSLIKTIGNSEFNAILQKNLTILERLINHFKKNHAKLNTLLEHLNIETRIRALENTTKETSLALINPLLQSPYKLSHFVESKPHLSYIEFYDSGNSHDNWSAVTCNLVALAPESHKRKADLDLSTQLNQYRPKSKSFSLNSCSFLRTQGRTIIFKNNYNNELIALKIQKKSESKDELYKEFATTRYFKHHGESLGLMSEFPEPICVTKLPGVVKLLHQNGVYNGSIYDLISPIGPHYAYVYKMNPKICNYFTYAHDPLISNEDFHKTNRIAINDYFKLLQHGVVFNQLADLFHNQETHHSTRYDGGRYYVLTNLLTGWDSGSGRLNRWRESVEYPNIGDKVIRDVGDRISINDLILNSPFSQKYFKDVGYNSPATKGNYLLANFIAEYQYVLFLIAGRRGVDLSSKRRLRDADIQKIWLNLANQIIENCAQAVSILTKTPEEEIFAFLSNIVDVNRLSRQMRYFMMGDYIPDIQQDRIKEGIYEKGTKVEVDFDNIRKGTFNSTHGFSIDGKHSDLGTVNGQEPIKEANKLFYWMVTYVFTKYHLYNETLKQVHAIVQSPDLKQAEELRKTSFSHLPPKSYHAIQKTLCAERLKQAAVPLADKKEIYAEMKEHTAQHAAYTIAQFWRKHKSKLDHDVEMVDVSQKRSSLQR